VFVSQRDFVDDVKRAGHPQVSWLPLAFDAELHRRQERPKAFDIGFAGAVSDIYVRRRTLLERLSRHFTISDYKRSYTPVEMAALYSESRLVFNCSLKQEVNMRVFE